jgi:hypothetical protein
MLRLKSLFRARAPGAGHAHLREKGPGALAEKALGSRARFRAETLYAEVDFLRELRPKAKALMVAEARRDPAWEVLGSVPFFGPVRPARITSSLWGVRYAAGASL